MANHLTSTPLVFDTTGGYFDGRNCGNLKSIVFSGNTDTDSTVLLYNAKNVVNNGKFHIWDRGTTTPPSGWVLSGTSAAIAQESTIVPTRLQTQNMVGSYSLKLTRSSNDCKIEQNVLSALPSPQNTIAWWRGRTIISGCWVYATVASRAYIETYDGQTSTTSSAHSGGSAWEWITTAAVAVHASADELTMRLIVKTGDTSAYFVLPLMFEARQIFYLKGADKPIAHTYGSTGIEFDGLYLQTMTGGTLQVQI